MNKYVEPQHREAMYASISNFLHVLLNCRMDTSLSIIIATNEDGVPVVCGENENAINSDRSAKYPLKCKNVVLEGAAAAFGDGTFLSLGIAEILMGIPSCNMLKLGRISG